MRHSSPKRCLSIVIVTLPLVGIPGCSSNLAPTYSPPIVSQWVVSWGAPPENAEASADNTGGAEQSFRFVVLPTIDGTKERIHLSNVYGSTPVVVGAARLAVAVGSGPAVDPATDRALTFNGLSGVTIPPGQQVVSDSVDLSYSFGQRLAVSVYVKGSFSPLTQHDSQVSNNFASLPGAGDTTPSVDGTGFPTVNTEWFLLTGLDVYGPYQGTVALFGSSSIDGHGSNYGSSNAYPIPNVPIAGQDDQRPSDWLARDLLGAGYRMGVLNAGTIGDPAGEDARTASGSSVAGVDRMSRDVLQQPGIKAVVIYFGGIDLRSDCEGASNVEASLTNMVAQAQAVGVRVILATLPPAEYCLSSSADVLPSTANPWQGDLNPGPENPGSTQRRALNDWIRTTGAHLPGVVDVADFDQALLYPAHPDFLQPNFTSSDNFHPNGAGYAAQAAAIPLSSLLGPQ